MKRSALPFVCGRQGRVCSNSTPAAAAASRKFAERRVMLDSAETVAAFAREMSEFRRTSEITENRGVRALPEMAGPSQIIAWQCERFHAHTYDVLDGATQVVSEKQQSAPQSRSRSRSRPSTAGATSTAG